jgi:uncharacterized protein (DUF1778 family)
MKKEKQLRLPTTDDQEEKIKQAAKKMSMTVAGYLRYCALEKAKELNRKEN